MKEDLSKSHLTYEKVLNTLEDYETLREAIVKDLEQWKKLHRLTIIGENFHFGVQQLNEIRKWLQDLKSILEKIKRNVEELLPNKNENEKKPSPEETLQKINRLSYELLKTALIVIKQPHPVNSPHCPGLKIYTKS